MREADTPVLIKAFAKPPQDQGKGLGLKVSIERFSSGQAVQTGDR